MPSPTGVWSPEEAATGHEFDYKLAQWLGHQLFSKEDMLYDMGCGPGTYLRYFHDIGFEKLKGIEGSNLNFEFGEVEVMDLTVPFQHPVIGNVMCLEVAEHIPEEYMHDFLGNIMNHTYGYLVLSWAIPGQDGLGHVNCKHNIWVIDHLSRKYNMHFMVETSLKARAMVSDRTHWLRDTLMIFKNK